MKNMLDMVLYYKAGMKCKLSHRRSEYIFQKALLVTASTKYWQYIEDPKSIYSNICKVALETNKVKLFEYSILKVCKRENAMCFPLITIYCVFQAQN